VHKDRTLVSRHNEKSVCSVGLVYERDELARNRCVHPGHSGSMPWLQSLRIWCCMGKLERCRPACVHKPFVTAETILVSRTQPITVVSAIGNDCTDDLCEKYQYHPPEVSFSASKGPLVPRKRAVSLENSDNPLMSGAPDDNSLPIFPDQYMRRFCTPVNPRQYEPRRVSFGVSKGPVVPRKRAVSLEVSDNPLMSGAPDDDSLPIFTDQYMRRFCTPVNPQQYEPHRVSFRSSKGPLVPRKRAVSLEFSDNPLMSGAPDDDSLPIFPDQYMRRFCTPVNPRQYEPRTVSFRSSKGPVVPRKRAVSLELFDDARFTQSLPTLSTANSGSMPASVSPEKKDPRRANVRFTKSRDIPSKRAVWLEDIGIM